MEFVNEFKKFIVRGNVFDMAVGVIIGGAFGKIVTSLVNDVIMPVIGIITGKIDISSLQLEIKSSIVGAEPVIVKYGEFLQNVLNFLIVAFCIFLMIKAMAKLIKKQEEEKPAPAPSKEEVLLTEIRDLLKNK